jgi:murein DD-endopeptidase MepM/ murein hydrolase activator NlpD
MTHGTATPWFGAGGALVLAILAAAYAYFTGPQDLSRYPPAETSPYRLPWPAGTTWLCVQGNRGVVSHRRSGEFAYDFKMPVGSDVCAARAGVVDSVDTSHDGHGLSAPNNHLRIDHEDGTFGRYLHLQKGGAFVHVGDRVRQGERIALSGHVGRSLLPHLHFEVAHVTRGRHVTIPITFADLKNDLGIPRMGRSYTSGNTPPATLGTWRAAEDSSSSGARSPSPGPALRG